MSMSIYIMNSAYSKQVDFSRKNVMVAQEARPIKKSTTDDTVRISNEAYALQKQYSHGMNIDIHSATKDEMSAFPLSLYEQG